MKFEELKLDSSIVKAVLEQGYEAPTAIQEQAIPLILEGSDLLGGAQTGTGKTAAFTLPLLHLLNASETVFNKQGYKTIRALVLTPTRELAAQVEESVKNYGKYLDLNSTVIFGGVGMNPQINKIKKGVDILVATPGRLLDLMQQGFIDLSHIQILVLDEADRMLDMGFIHDVKKVLAAVPAQKQSLLFSATFSDEIRELAGSLLRSPKHIQVTPSNTTVQRISQVIHPVGRTKKKALLAHIIKEHNWSQVLVFTRTKFGANNVAEFLTKNGIESMALHGNKSQSARTQALQDFKSGTIRALVATDIAARGIDIDELPHVVNYEIPNVSEDYVHRIGRTGRAGNTGHAVSLVCLDEEGFMYDIERFSKQKIEVVIVEGFGPDTGEKAEPIAMGRQTIWGGAGKPPSRDVMAASAKAARTEMMERIREKKSTQPSRSGAPANPRNTRNPRNAPQTTPRRDSPATDEFAPPNHNRPRNTEPRGTGAAPRSSAGRPPQRSQLGRRNPNNARGDFAGNNVSHENPYADTRRPNPNLGGQPARNNYSSQPDPLRTNVDSMQERGRRGGGGGNSGGGYAGNRSNSGGGGNYAGGGNGGNSGTGGNRGGRGPFGRR